MVHDALKFTVREVEGFEIAIYNGNVELKGSANVDVKYDYMRAAPKNLTVSKWISQRLDLSDSNLSVVVLDGDGYPVHGRTKLNTVRNSYEVQYA